MYDDEEDDNRDHDHHLYDDYNANDDQNHGDDYDDDCDDNDYVDYDYDDGNEDDEDVDYDDYCDVIMMIIILTINFIMMSLFFRSNK